MRETKGLKQRKIELSAQRLNDYCRGVYVDYDNYILK